MRLIKTLLLAAILVLLIGGWLIQPANLRSQVLAQSGILTPTGEPENPRHTQITIAFTKHTWWVSRYSNNEIVCTLTIEHEGLPTAEDIEAFCSQAVYREWVNVKPCPFAEVGSIEKCPGLYLILLKSEPGERQIDVELPEPSVWASVTNCNPQPPENRCSTLPSLLLTGEEPLPNETIVNISGTIDNEPFTCGGETCVLPLKPTGMEGTVIEFWADSSFGDSTDRFTARYRLVPWGEFMNPEAMTSDPRQWYVDVLSTQWRDGELATCTEAWQVFPPIGGPSFWLSSPENPADLESDISYYYLAGSLITYGVVDASGCLDGGLQAPNIASACGVEAARPELMDWQNRFDGEILQVSQDTGVPARLLKNVFSRESQIWPGIYTTYKEAGLGQLTEKGADTVLLWNWDFFNQFCPLVLNEAYCKLGFANLEEPEQNLLRGALVHKVNASCPGCPAGIDLSKANFSVNVFAEGLLANCNQVAQVITNQTGMSPGQLSSYEDLWRFTLVNYNAGPGCLSRAVYRAWVANQPINWETVSSYLEPACQPAVGYVEDITRELRATPTPTVWLPPSGDQPTPVLPRIYDTPTPTAIVPTSPATLTPVATITRTPGGPTLTPTVTPTPGGPTPTVTETPLDYP